MPSLVPTHTTSTLLGRSGCAAARLAAPRATAARSTGSTRATRTRAKSRNSESNRDKSIRLAHDEVSKRALVHRRAWRASQRLDRAPNGGKRILDLVRERCAQLRDRLETLGARVQGVETLLIRNVLKDRRRRRTGRTIAAFGARCVQADRKPSIANRDRTLGAVRACPVLRCALERACQLWRRPRDRFDDVRTNVIIERKTEQLRCSRICIDETARGVDRDDSAAYVLEDVGRLETYFHQLRRELLRTRASLAQPSRDVSAPERDRGEHTELQPDAEIQLRSRRYDHVREIQDAPERRDQQPAGERQEERRGSDDENVQGGELRAAAAGDVYDRGNDQRGRTAIAHRRNSRRSGRRYTMLYSAEPAVNTSAPVIRSDATSVSPVSAFFHASTAARKIAADMANRPR